MTTLKLRYSIVSLAHVFSSPFEVTRKSRVFVFQHVIDCNALAAFPRLLEHTKPSIVKEAAWTISNITAGNTSQIQAVIDQQLIPLIIKVLETGDFKSQKEAVWVVTNLTSGGTTHQIGYVVQMGLLPALCNLLDAKDSKMVIVILDGLNNILQVPLPTPSIITHCHDFAIVNKTIVFFAGCREGKRH